MPPGTHPEGSPTRAARWLPTPCSFWVKPSALAQPATAKIYPSVLAWGINKSCGGSATIMNNDVSVTRRYSLKVCISAHSKREKISQCGGKTTPSWCSENTKVKTKDSSQAAECQTSAFSIDSECECVGEMLRCTCPSSYNSLKPNLSIQVPSNSSNSKSEFKLFLFFSNIRD